MCLRDEIRRMINDYKCCYKNGLDDAYLEDILDCISNDSDEEVVTYIHKHLVNMLKYIKKMQYYFDGYMNSTKNNIMNFVEEYADVFIEYVEV